MNATHTPAARDDAPLKNTDAAKMMARALDRDGAPSQRALANMMNYKSSVVISHMASGRAPIPFERAEKIALLLNMNPTDFLFAVLEQRVPRTNWRAHLAGSTSSAPRSAADDEMIDDLERIAGARLCDLPKEKLDVVRSALSDRAPERRWLTLSELPFVEELRELEPEFRFKGLPAKVRTKLFSAAGFRTAS